MITTVVILFVVIALIVIIIGYVIGLYNSLVRIHNNVKEAWSNIDVLLKQRHDELPKLIAACQEYMSYEQETLQKVVEARNLVEAARSSGQAEKLGNAENIFRRSLGGLFAVAENYPDLKSNASFQQLQKSISSLENKIADRRELYNDHVNINNIRIQQFPAVLIAKQLHFSACDLLEFSDEEKADIDVKKLFNQ